MAKYRRYPRGHKRRTCKFLIAAWDRQISLDAQDRNADALRDRRPSVPGPTKTKAEKKKEAAAKAAALAGQEQRGRKGKGEDRDPKGKGKGKGNGKGKEDRRSQTPHGDRRPSADPKARNRICKFHYWGNCKDGT